ncbi:MAG TPA: DUF222 domain-containing protein, partial [Candidatus Sulfotelmatobacter sp.]|nr:DUF222 domain-containing protein [Candidatus Sulfotelmatobacter sp.]
MKSHSLTHVSNGALLQRLSEQVAVGRRGTAEVVALIAEIQKRRLYAAAGFPSMHVYCIEKLGFSEDEADRRIQAARAARRFPIILDLLADGRVHLTGVRLLRPYLTPVTANSLLRASIHKTRKEIEQLLADRFPRPDVPSRVVVVAQAGAEPVNSANGTQPVPMPMDESISPAPERMKPLENLESSDPKVLGTTPDSPTPPPTSPPMPPPRVAPLGTERYSLQLTMTRPTHDLLRRAQELLDPQVPAGDLDTVLRRGLELLVAQLEKRKLAATSRPSKRAPRPSANPRYIPARVRRAVAKRDGNRCAFVGDGGRRC